MQRMYDGPKGAEVSHCDSGYSATLYVGGEQFNPVYVMNLSLTTRLYTARSDAG